MTFIMAWIRSSLLASSFFFISLVSLQRNRHQEEVSFVWDFWKVRVRSRREGSPYVSKVSLRVFRSAACFSLASSIILVIC